MNRREFLKAGGAFSLLALVGGYSRCTTLKEAKKFSPLEGETPIFFSATGDRFYVVNYYRTKVFEYTLGSRYDISTACYNRTILTGELYCGGQKS